MAFARLFDFPLRSTNAQLRLKNIGPDTFRQWTMNLLKEWDAGGIRSTTVMAILDTLEIVWPVPEEPALLVTRPASDTRVLPVAPHPMDSEINQAKSEGTDGQVKVKRRNDMVNVEGRQADEKSEGVSTMAKRLMEK